MCWKENGKQFNLLERTMDEFICLLLCVVLDRIKRERKVKIPLSSKELFSSKGLGEDWWELPFFRS